MTRDDALSLVTSWTKNPNLVKHMLAVEAIMRHLAKHFSQDEDLWGLAGLLHDADYEMFKDEPIKHPSKIFAELESRHTDPRIIQAIRAHAWGWQPDAPQPASKMDWSLFASDELSGLIIAVALVQPDKKLSSVSLESIKKKWTDKTFAKGVNRAHAEMAPANLGLSLDDFISLNLSALQSIAPQLGL